METAKRAKQEIGLRFNGWSRLEIMWMKKRRSSEIREKTDIFGCKVGEMEKSNRDVFPPKWDRYKWNKMA